MNPTALHSLPATPTTVHWGYFDAAGELRLQPGRQLGLPVSMSVAADFGVTQVVDGRKGIHVRIARGIFPGRQGNGRD